jgi:hypothetical protein
MGKPDPERAAYSVRQRAPKGNPSGRRIPVRRPECAPLHEQGLEWEMHLDFYDTIASVDLLADHMVARG